MTREEVIAIAKAMPRIDRMLIVAGIKPGFPDGSDADALRWAELEQLMAAPGADPERGQVWQNIKARIDAERQPMEMNVRGAQ